MWGLRYRVEGHFNTTFPSTSLFFNIHHLSNSEPRPLSFCLLAVEFRKIDHLHHCNKVILLNVNVYVMRHYVIVKKLFQ